MLKVETKHTLKICKAHINTHTHTQRVRTLSSIFFFFYFSFASCQFAILMLLLQNECNEIFLADRFSIGEQILHTRTATDNYCACEFVYKPNCEWLSWIFGKNVWIPFARKFIQINFKKTRKQTHTHSWM